MAFCAMLKFTGDICGSTNLLNPIFFYDSEYKTITKTFACQHHSDELLTILLEEIKTFQHRQRKNFSKLKERKITAKNYDITFDSKAMYTEIESDKDVINRIRWKFCRHPTCEKRNFFYDELIHTMMVFSTRGKLRHLFYFHKICCQKIMAQCGIKAPWQGGQKTLDMMQ